MSHDSSPSPPDAAGVPAAVPGPRARPALTAFAWLWVGAPLCYGVYELVQKATQLFSG
ncbi:hypothetical protein ACFXAW_37785 [Streptomyces sp. NPDC059445]|uniref:MFS transporter small subunit n=1 Tax=Streptomyces sp. NPDC059445 TaxID=3346832 RepID=UPI0036827947